MDEGDTVNMFFTRKVIKGQRLEVDTLSQMPFLGNVVLAIDMI